MANAVPAIELAGLTKRYGTKVAVDHLDLRVPRGEIFGLLGPNGAGKTTTILMLLGLTERTEGSAAVDGIDPARHPLEVKRQVGYLPDDVGFYDDLTGRENLRYTARLNRLPGRTADRRISDLLDQVGLADAADRKVRGYSRGMRQRLGLADALVKDPTILVLDEPTVNIDPEGVRDLLAMVRRLRDDDGMTVLLSSHLLHQVEQICDRIGIFVSGRLAAVGPIEKLAAGVEHRWTVELGVRGGDADPLPIVGRVSGVTLVEPDGNQWLVHSDHDVRTEIVDAVREAGLGITHLHRRGADLDAIYHRYFIGAEHGDAA